MSSHELRVRVQHLNQDIFHEAKAEGKVNPTCRSRFQLGVVQCFGNDYSARKQFPGLPKSSEQFFGEEKVKSIRNRFGNHAIEARK